MTDTINAIGAVIIIVFLLMMCSVPVPESIEISTEVTLEVPESLKSILTPLDLQWIIDGKLVEGTPEVMLLFISNWMNSDPQIQTWYSEELNSILLLSQMVAMKSFGNIWGGLVFEGDSLFSGGIANRTYWDKLIVTGNYIPIEFGQSGITLGGG